MGGLPHPPVMSLACGGHGGLNAPTHLPTLYSLFGWWSLEPTYLRMILMCVNVCGLVWGQCMCHSTLEIVMNMY
jgi:hypothetical protein